ncbi:MAG TPA: type II secretion system F family protein [Lachnospiraceae bacterium]|nr:type II secretion system F family protein [Lachnospiraceae bacterium]
MLNNSELSTYFDQMAMVLSAGITPEEGLDILKCDAASESGKQLLGIILDSVSGGSFLADAMENTGEFPVYASALTRIGEKSGNLDHVFSSLASYYKRAENLSEGIREALTYPLVMIFMMLAVIGILIARVLPVFNSVYAELGSSLTGLPQALLSFSVSSGNILLIIFALLAILLTAGAILLIKSPSFRSRFFLSRKFMMKISESRFAGGLSLALSSGLDVDDSLEMAAKLADHPAVREKIEKARSYLAEGMGFSEAVGKAEIFSGLTNRMVDIGVKSGTTDAVMEKIAEQYDHDIDTRIGRLLGILEPTLVIVLALITGVILLSVMMPLLSIMSGIA